MENISWEFPLLGSGNEQGYTNSGIETFKGIEIMDNLAREICQNSLDAKDDSIDAPVIVEFKIISLKKSEYSVFSDLEKCIEGCKKY